MNERPTELPESGAITLVIGGARSGKSAHAEKLIGAFEPPWLYIATAQAFDEEMAKRIADHRERRDDRWQTIEAPLDLAGTLATAEHDKPVLVDCLTLWLTNQVLAGNDIAAQMAALLETLEKRTAPCVVVSNEVGQGIVPDNALSREFRDQQGRLNQHAAAIAGAVVLMVAGIPVKVK